jgi:hypothetical protein
MEASKNRSLRNLRIAVCAQQNLLGQQTGIGKSERELLGKLAAALTKFDCGNEHPTSPPAVLKELGRDVSPPLVPKSDEAGVGVHLPRLTPPRKGDLDAQRARGKTKPNAPSLPAADPSLRTFKSAKEKIFRGRSLVISVTLVMAAGLATGAAWPWRPALNSSASVATQNDGQTSNSDLIASVKPEAMAQPTGALANPSFGELSAKLNSITQEVSSLREEMKAVAARQDQFAGAQAQLTTAQARLAIVQEQGAAKQDQVLQAIAKLTASEQSKHRSPVPVAPKRVAGTAAAANVVEPAAPPPPPQQQDPVRPTPPMPVPDHYIPLSR